MIVVAYKPDSSDYCMGCHMASYGSDLKIFTFKDIPEAVEKLAPLNVNMDTSEDGYEFIVIKPEDQYEGSDWEWLIETGYYEFQCLIRERTSQLIEEAKALAAKKAAEEKIVQAKKAEEKARAEYEKLKQRFGDGLDSTSS